MKRSAYLLFMAQRPLREPSEEQRTTRDTSSNTTDTAAAPTGSSLSILEKMKYDAASVLNGRLPVSRTSEPNSPTARANARPAPAMMAGARFGMMIRRNTVVRLAPSDSAACSISRSSSSSTG